MSRAKYCSRECLIGFEWGKVVIFHCDTKDAWFRGRKSQKSFGGEIEDAEDWLCKLGALLIHVVCLHKDAFCSDKFFVHFTRPEIYCTWKDNKVWLWYHIPAVANAIHDNEGTDWSVWSPVVSGTNLFWNCYEILNAKCAIFRAVPRLDPHRHFTWMPLGEI